ncbi:uncharacterized protein AB9X84_015096 [Acanthopagrus schlegelii]
MAPLLFLLFLLSEAASDPEVIQVVQVVQVGQDATLPCDTGDVTIGAVEWIRSEPDPSTDILFWTDGHITSPIEDRVQLVDGELKTGDVSLTLKNVKREDNGTYECRVITAASRRNKRAANEVKLIKTIQLQVTENNNHVGLAAAVGVFLLVSAAVVAVGLFLARKSKRQREKKPEPSAAEETGDNLI